MTDNDRSNQEENEMEALETSAGSNVKDAGFWKEFWYQVRLVWYLLRDPEVPIYVKVVPLAALIYVLIPTDLIPDVFPVMGQLDDITALLVGGKVFIEMSPNHVVRKYLELLRQRSGVDPIDSGLDGVEATGLEESIVIEGDFETIDPDSTEEE
jgi:uncharacterized membrane protein YkvA (DUF1232 family)